MVVEHLADPSLGPKHRVLPETLTVRESTAPLNVKPPRRAKRRPVDESKHNTQGG
jgi:hypothetical protein